MTRNALVLASLALALARLRRRGRRRCAQAAADAERRALPSGRQLERADRASRAAAPATALVRRHRRIASRSPYGRRPEDVRSGSWVRTTRTGWFGSRLRDGRGDAHRRRRQARAQRGGRAAPSSSPRSTPADLAQPQARGMPIERPARSGRGSAACACAMRWTRASTAAPAGAARRATVSTWRKSCSAVASSSPSASRVERMEDVQPARVAVEHLRRHARAGRRAAPRAGARGGSRR